MSKKNKGSFSDRFRDKFRVTVYNDNTYKEVWFIRLSRINFLALIGGITLLIIAGVFSLVAYTGIREFIPGYPDGNMRRNILINALKLDSLEKEMQMRDQYFANLNAIISGGQPDNMLNTADTSVRYEKIEFKKSAEDSLLRHQIEEEEQYNLSVPAKTSIPKRLSSIYFFTPLRGMVTNSFNARLNHFGTDIVAGPNEVVKATLDGTVIMAAWTLETGYVIQVQHKYNLISVYKHNAELLKEVGNIVKAGEPVAIMGNSGELTTGPHLHFELWYNGTPLDPEQYVVF